MLQQTFYVSVATAALSIVGSILIPWLSVKKEKKEKQIATDTGKSEAAEPDMEMSGASDTKVVDR